MQEIPRCDLHVHTKYLGCARPEMEIPAIIKECERLGVTKLGITDHLNFFEDLDKHLPIKTDIEALDTTIDVYFGAELNFMALDGDFAFNAEIKERYGFQYAIGGIHNTYLEEYNLQQLVDIQHRHHLKTCANPLVDVLVHPYWFVKPQFDRKGWPWFDTMRAVPERYARELGQAARETGTAIEINAASNLENKNFSKQYVEEYIAFLAIIAEEGASFSLGSDAHYIDRLKGIASAWQVAAQLKLTPDRIWLPKCQPMKSAVKAG